MSTRVPPNKGMRTYTVFLQLIDSNGEMDGDYQLVVKAKNSIGARYAAIMDIRWNVLELTEFEALPHNLKFRCRAVYAGRLKNLLELYE